MRPSEGRRPTPSAGQAEGGPDPWDGLDPISPGRRPKAAAPSGEVAPIARLDALPFRTSLEAAARPDGRSRTAVRTRVLRRTDLPFRAARLAAADIERRRSPLCGTRGDLAEHLEREADRLSGLWDDPRLPCDDDLRRVMLFSVPVLLERAERLRAPIGPDRGRPARERGWRLVLRGAARRLTHRGRSIGHGAMA